MEWKSIKRMYILIISLKLFSYGLILSNFQLFLIDFGLSTFEISVLISVPFITIFLFEIPTGAYADVMGRKNSFLLSCILSMIGMLIYYLGNHFLLFFIAEVIAGIGFTFSSGSIDAWIVDKLGSTGHKDKVQDVFIDLSIYGNVATLISGFVGALIASKSLRLPRLMGAVGLAITFFITFILIDDIKRERGKMSFQAGIKKITKVSRDSVQIGINNKPFRLLLINGSIVTLCIAALSLWQTYFKTSFNMDVQTFGFFWIMISLSNVIGGFILKRLKKLSNHIIIIISIVGYGFTVLSVTMFSKPIYAIVLFVLSKISVSFFIPTQMTLVNECIDEKYRATTLSFYSMITEFLGGIGIVIVGFISQTWSISISWRVLGTLGIISVLIYSTLISRYKVRLQELKG